MELRGLRVSFHTLGCKVNIYESEVMESQIEKAGGILTDFEDSADICIINTCSVTNIADRKSRQMIHRAKEKNPEAVIVACGCYAVVEEAEKLYETGVDLILGNQEKENLIPILEDFLQKGVRPVLAKPNDIKVISDLTLTDLKKHTRADVRVQDGCNQFCTYCIIPYARGRIRSKKLEEAVEEIKGLAEQGIQEVVLTGIHMGSYEDEGRTLIDLIEAVNQIEGIQRIRFGSLEPRTVTRDFTARLAKCEKICPHFHLSLQSGSADTLKHMNRHYTPAEYKESVGYLREYFPMPAITTDVICGFPGETEETFQESFDFVQNIVFYELHVFQYSKRKGTVAAKMQNQVPEEVKKRRSKQMIELGQLMSKEFEKAWDGHTVELLTEEPVLYEGKKAFAGYTREYIRALSFDATSGNQMIHGTLSYLEDGTCIVE